MSREELERIAHLAEICIVPLEHGGTYKAEEVNQLLARQRLFISGKIRQLEASETS